MTRSTDRKALRAERCAYVRGPIKWYVALPCAASNMIESEDAAVSRGRGFRTRREALAWVKLETGAR